MSKTMKDHFPTKRTLAAVAVSSALFFSTPNAMAADNFSGTLKGNVTASTNVVANATVKVVHREKGITRTVTADDQGSYVLRKLPIGEYTVTIEKQGFHIDSFNVLVKVGSSALVNRELYESNQDIERIEVTGRNVSFIELDTSEGGIVVTADELSLLPVNTGFNNMALLAPGTAATNGGNFRGSPSIGGSSSAENGYYLNGLNVTKIKTGLGTIDLPWEAIAQTEIKTGGVAPEFGNALGGIVNAISKSGSNEFKFGVQARVDPEALREHHDDQYNLDGTFRNNTEDDESTFTRYSVWGSGAIIKDQLFFYGLYAPQSNDYDDAGTNTIARGESKSDRWFAKLDWFITENHSVEFTSINYKNDNKWTNFGWDPDANETTGDGTDATSKTGGDVLGFKYTGILSDDISLEVIAGRVTDQTFNTVADQQPSIWSRLSGSWVNVSQHTSSTITESEFTRDQLRADLTWDLEEHSLKFGVDYYDTHIDHQSTQNGTGDALGWWTARLATGSDRSGLPVGQGYIDKRIRRDFSDSHVKSLSIYAQDSWQVTDDLVLNLGVRYSNFTNEMSDGQEYVDVSGQIAPRLQAIYDLSGDGTSKVFATFGRYYQPVSANMNIVQGGSRRDEHWYYELGEVDSNGDPIKTADLSPSRGKEVSYWLAQSGEGAPGSKATAGLESMYSDEFTLGYQTEVFDGDMTFGVRGTYRNLKRSIEDANLATVLENWYEKQGREASGIDGWILFNPGDGLDVNYDFNGDGTTDHIVLSAEEVGQPKSKRKYVGLEFTLDGQVTDKINISSSYTWSHLWGNTSGLVSDDDNQADPGWTVSYDYAGLQDHAHGNLPSDRRHAFKVFGTYKVTDNFVIGLNTAIADGKPISKLGIHPFGVGACAPGLPWESCPSNTNRGHGTSFYDENDQPSPRGSAGTTDWTFKFDLSASYSREVFGNDLTLKATVYNLLNSDTQTTVYQTGTTTGDNGTIADPEFGQTRGRLGARFVSLTARYVF